MSRVRYSPRRVSSVVLVLRWLFGMALVSWRYLWQITPLYRVERDRAVLEHDPPSIPARLQDDDVQPAERGVGPLFHRRFAVHIVDSRFTAPELMSEVIRDFQRFVPSEVVHIDRSGSSVGALEVGDELVVEMPGPWNGPVRVVDVGGTHLRLATLRGHLEAGQVLFHAWPEGGRLTFEIEVWARPSSGLLRLLYCHLRLAKEIQLNMWVRFCRAAVETAGGRPDHGVHIRTHRISSHALGRVEGGDGARLA